MVPRAGVEPARPFGQRILSPQRLPFRHPGTHAKIARRLNANNSTLMADDSLCAVAADWDRDEAAWLYVF